MSERDRIAETLKALERGESPPCPWCGAEFTRIGDEGCDCPHWKCGSYRFFYETNLSMEWHWSQECHARQIDVLRAENARLREALRRIVDNEVCECPTVVTCEIEKARQMLEQADAAKEGK